MAITQNPLIGRASGAYGGTVFTTFFNKNVIKTKPVTVRNPKTAAQIAQRNLMTLAGNHVKECYSFYSKAIPSGSVGMPSFAAIVKSILNNDAFDAGKTKVDTKKVLDNFSPSDLSSYAALVTAGSSCDLTITNLPSLLLNNTVDVLFFNITKNKFSIISKTVTDPNYFTVTSTPVDAAISDEIFVYFSIRNFSYSSSERKLFFFTSVLTA